MSKLRVASVVLALAFLTLAGCETTVERPPDWFTRCDSCGNSP
ncbi:MAG: hypothetical protein QF578_18655 [Alphaproteobacteria bacterium]|nr:hypothetical protein [Alphaproteobacteria bacterium]MDP6566856.1 hypothetical protein [Alphaproteobacteria bacterium]MDP6813456.1 hypothetical protein [Alphaproteobacteria bacterium]